MTALSLLRKVVALVANPLMMRYAATRGDDREMRRYDERGMYSEMNDRPEMRRRRDSRGRYMAMEEDSPERIHYDGTDTGYPEFRPYEPGERGFKKEGEFGNIPRKSRIVDGLYDGGGMGFGYEPPSNHYGKHHEKPVKAGGTFWMDNGDEDEPLDRVTAERWVKSMEAPDNQQHPRGGRWTMEETNKYAEKVGLPMDEQKRVEFYAIMNARYMDDGMVLKKFGLTDPMVFACLAKAWLEDADAVEDKAAKYYKYIVKK